jgi:hypothetical protein
MIIITHSITITGPGSAVLSISGGDASPIFRINFVNVSISGLTLTHGRVLDGYGAAIDNQSSSTLILDQVVISYNNALNATGSGGYGGAIINSGSLIISNSTLSYNTATNQGGALYDYYSAGLQMSNVIVDHNQAITEDGGGLFIRGSSTPGTPPTVLLDRVSITNNSADANEGEGGGIWSEDSITIMNSLIANNSAYYSGGLLIKDAKYPAGITITNTTITGNTSIDGASGLLISFAQSSSEALLNNLTIVNNQSTALVGGGGIAIGSTGVTGVQNTIIAGNTSNGATPDDCYGPINSQDYNLIQTTTGCTITGSSTHNIYGVSPQLAALAQNGGPTQSMALMAGSPAIDAGNPLTPGPGTNACESLDQRGITRPRGMLCDIGAYELEQYMLVDDDDNNPDVRSSYTDTLTALGKTYYVWDTANSDNEPDAATLANYAVVIWFTGAESHDAGGGYAGPGAAGETALSTYLNGGGKFFISSQDYNYDKGLTGLMTGYLGVSAVADKADQTIVTGAGSVFYGLGPYTLSYPFENWSDLISPDATAEVAFTGNSGNAGVDKNSATYCTAYLGFPFEAIASLADRQQVMNAFFDWCSPTISHSLPLVPGWNLVSLPLHPFSTAILDVLASLAGNYDLVYAWDASGGHVGAGNWMRYAPGIPGNTLATLDETQGFWIRMTSDDMLEITGFAHTTTNISLSTTASDWNLVGYPSIVNRNMPEALTAHGVTDYSLVYAYHTDDSDTWKRYAPGVPGNDLLELVPGWGYWIKVGTTSTWDVEY